MPGGRDPIITWGRWHCIQFKCVRDTRVARFFDICMKRKAEVFEEHPYYRAVKKTPKTYKQQQASDNWRKQQQKERFVVVQKPKATTVNVVANPRIGGYLGIEKKFLDSSASLTVASPTDCTGAEADPTTLNCLNGISQGDGESNRDGKNYIIKGITFDGVVYRNQLAGQANINATVSTFTTVAIVLDTQTNGAQLNSEDVYTNPSAAANGNSDLLRNLQYSKRFKVLKKWVCVDPMGPMFTHNGATYDIGGTAHNISFYADNLDIKVSCTGTGNTVSSIVDNSLHVVAFTSGVNLVTLRYNARIRFVG